MKFIEGFKEGIMFIPYIFYELYEYLLKPTAPEFYGYLGFASGMLVLIAIGIGLFILGGMII